MHKIKSGLDDTATEENHTNNKGWNKNGTNIKVAALKNIIKYSSNKCLSPTNLQNTRFVRSNAH